MKKLLIPLLLTLLASSNAFAVQIGTVSGAKVHTVRVDWDGKGMIVFDRPIGGTPPSCVNPAYNNAFGFDTTTDSGKAVLSFALTAKASNATVTAHGLGKCGVYGGSVVETWNHGFIF